MAATSQWHIATKGSRSDGLSLEQLRDMRDAGGRLTEETMVWREGYHEWVPARSTELLDLFYAPVDPTVPPALPASAVDNRLIWVLAFAPALGLFLQGFVSVLLDIDFDTLWWIVIAINLSLAVLDERRLQAAGHSTEGWGGWAWFLIPVYLFQRAKKLRQTPSYAWTWVGVFILSLFFG